MDVWLIVAVAVVGWCLISVLAGVVLGHVMAGKPLRVRVIPEAHVAPGVVLPVLSTPHRAVDAAV